VNGEPSIHSTNSPFPRQCSLTVLTCTQC